MNYLELVKRLAQETGSELQARIDSVSDIPATAYGSTTEHINRLINWVAQAWLEIQLDQPDWRFMRSRGTLPLSVGISSYDPTADLTIGATYDGLQPFVAPLDRRYIWCVNTNTDPIQKQPCYYVPPEHFFGYRDRVTSDRGPPSRYSIESDGCIVVDPAPGLAGYELEFDYRLLPQTLAVDADTPTILPTKFHMLIVYWAMVDHAGLDEAEKQYGRAVQNRKRMMSKLRLEQLPEYTMPGTR